MKHKAHMNRFTALNTALTVSFAAFGLFAVTLLRLRITLALVVMLVFNVLDHNNDVTDRFSGMAIGVNTKATGHSGIAIGTSTNFCR